MMAEDKMPDINWLVQINDIAPLWKAQPTYILSQAVYLVAGVLTFIHALSKGGRWPWFWVATVLHGIFSDIFSHIIVPDYDNFWHSQTPVIFLGGRLPLHIIFVYPVLIYNAAYAVSKLKLPFYSEPFAVGALTILLDIPYDVVAVRFIHWTWHDTDPNVFDRFYNVPWNSFYFHSTFTTALFFLFHVTSSTRKSPNKWGYNGFFRELKSLVISVALALPLGVMAFVPLYHPLHDSLKIHTEVTFFILFAFYSAIILVGLMDKRTENTERLNCLDYLLLVQIAVHFLLYWVLVAFGHPERERSVGLHEPIGPCDARINFITPFGKVLQKKKYLCLPDYNEPYYDFECVEQFPLHYSKWYTICGVPFRDRPEYIAILTAMCMFAGLVFYGLYFKTLTVPVVQSKKATSHKHRDKKNK